MAIGASFRRIYTLYDTRRPRMVPRPPYPVNVSRLYLCVWYYASSRRSSSDGIYLLQGCICQTPKVLADGSLGNSVEEARSALWLPATRFAQA